VPGWKGEQQQALANHSNRLHDQCFYQRTPVLARVPQGHGIRHIPHQEQQAHAPDHAIPGSSAQLKGRRKRAWICQEGQGALHVEKEYQSN